MLKHSLIISLIICLSFPLIAQMSDEDFFEMDYKQKSARKAMLLSTIFPGAGQFYVNPKAPTAYIFSVIEIGLWVGYFHFYNEGKKIEEKYEKYANKEVIGHYEQDITDGITTIFNAGDPIYRYDRTRQYFAQEDLMDNTQNQMYDTHFRLDETNTQHFYEDIGKYNKYIFGWADWFDVYATTGIADDAEDIEVDINWIWDENTQVWTGNHVQNDESEYYTPKYEEGRYSEMRANYIDMRKEAEENYFTANMLTIGAAINRVVSAFDAMRVANKQNLEYLSKHDVNIKLSPVLVNNQLSAGFFIQKRF